LVSGSVNGQQWIKPTRLSIIIRPAIWQRTSARVIAALVFLVVVVYVISNRFRRSVAREREKLQSDQKFAELELRALQAQMNPHFIFNSINAIQHFMLNNDELSANTYLSKFARLMRLYLESSKNKYIAITEEIELLQLYVHLEKLRFEDKFDYSFTVDPYFKHTALEIPSMLLQPYVENAINHGLALRKTQGSLNVRFSRTASGITCVIDDDGVGRSFAAARNGNHRSRGMDIINERLGAYRLVDNIEITTQVIDKTDNEGKATGTRVEVFIPAKLD
jgi:sensor histidine kinase YesM